MPVAVVWLSLHNEIDSRGPWDTAILESLFANDLWDTGHTFEHHVLRPNLDEDHMSTFESLDRAIVVLPARHHTSDEDLAILNALFAGLRGILLILVGDEEAVFPWREIHHDNMRMWVMLPRPDVHADLGRWAFYFGDGFTPGVRERFKDSPTPLKPVQWSFSGQITNGRRKQAANGLRLLRSRIPGELLETQGFTQGISRSEFLAQLRVTKIAPAPGGPCTADTFRMYEALEAGCVPLADETCQQAWYGYWRFMYPDDPPPFPIVSDWESVGGVVEDELRFWPRGANLASSWWMRRKREMAKRLHADLGSIGLPTPLSLVTVIITTSPTLSHPSTDMLEETLRSVWYHLGDVQIVIACDGVRPEQLDMADGYHEYVRQVCWKAQHHWHNVLPVVMREWGHQAHSTRKALESVDSELILFMEHDTPLMTDREIDWKLAIDVMQSGAIDVLRFHHEASVLAVHEHLMLDTGPSSLFGLPVRRTMQWSQRPHLANTDYYRRILKEHFPAKSRTMIEDRMHSVCQSEPYAKNRIAMYHPDGDIKRSTHTDGRGAEPKYEMRFN